MQYLQFDRLSAALSSLMAAAKEGDLAAVGQVVSITRAQLSLIERTHPAPPPDEANDQHSWSNWL
jgi:hypothetical protein